MAHLIDYHVHTEISRDSSAPYFDMVLAEYDAGVRHLCVTDHCDTVDWQTMDFYPPCRDVADREREMFEEYRDRLPKDLHLRMGMELAEVHFHPELIRELAAPDWLDFILGSFHITKEYGDFHEMDYRDPAFRAVLWEIYFNGLDEVASYDYFDVMAHIGYWQRYARQQGIDEPLTLRRHGDRVEHLLKTLIGRGRGIELNTSGLRDGCGPFPSDDVLRLYRELGGEIITVGSDAHRTADAAKCVGEGLEILKRCGFRYVTVFTKRRPDFIPIG